MHGGIREVNFGKSHFFGNFRKIRTLRKILRRCVATLFDRGPSQGPPGTPPGGGPQSELGLPGEIGGEM